MPNEIPNESVPAPVIQLNNFQYITDDGQYDPKTINVPCGVNALVDPYQWWAIPVKNYGIVSILQMVPAINGNVDQPTPDSVSVIRVRDQYNHRYTWWVISSLEDYYAACQVCCGEDPVPIPTPVLPIIVPCQNVCEATNDAGNYFVTFGAPALGAGQEYQTFGQFQGEELPAFESSSLTDLVNDLNSKYGTIGSPSFTIVWTRSGNTIIGTFQNGTGEDESFCLLITAIENSP